MDLVGRENVPIPDVSRLIRTDAAFTAEVLRLANSAMFGLRYEVVSILHAISVLGMDRLKALVLTVGMRDFLSGASQMELMKRCWRHNLASALSSEWLADYCRVDKSVAYTAGLLHDLGRLALMMMNPAQYHELIRMVEETGQDIAECEKLAFGIDTCEAGVWVAQDWSLPAALREVICCHHQIPPAAACELSLVAPLGCRVADSLGFTVMGPLPEDNHNWVRESLPADLWEKVETRLPELYEMVPFKINLFECEFLNR